MNAWKYSGNLSLEKLGTIRAQARRFAQACGFPSGDIDDIELAVDEAVTNVLLHAYPSGQTARVEILGERRGRAAVISIRDFGRSFTPTPVTDAQVRRVLDERQRHGLGRYLIQKCMSSVEYLTSPGKYNEIHMTKRLQPV